MMPASLSAVLARIGAIQSRFGISGDASGDAGGGTSTFASVLNQVSGGASGTGSSAAAELGKLPQSERELIISQARREGVDPALALAVVLQESGGNPSAVSPSGALGLMQLMPGTVQELGVSKPLDPTQNLAGGLDYLRQKLTEFGSVPLGLAAYNAGSGAVSSWGGVPPYPETQSYVSNIMRARDDIARQLASGTAGGSTGTDPTHRGAAGAAGARLGIERRDARGPGIGARLHGRGQGPGVHLTERGNSAAPASTGGTKAGAPASDRVDVSPPARDGPRSQRGSRCRIRPRRAGRQAGHRSGRGVERRQRRRGGGGGAGEDRQRRRLRGLWTGRGPAGCRCGAVGGSRRRDRRERRTGAGRRRRISGDRAGHEPGPAGRCGVRARIVRERRVGREVPGRRGA